ncbi:MAG: metallophosphoesterase, partial [Eubacterium sp.]|nr:metallophosphoesterase [Eubacterium sp.]
MKLTFIADTHHYSKTLGTSGRAYELRSGSDQKCLAETGEIIDAAFKQIAESDTDAVFILGDVTNDGEMVSHIEFREKLYELKKSKQVYIITATHDWCCDGNPRRFDGECVFNDVDVMKSEDLPEFYKDFGPNQAIDKYITKIGTICYTVQLNEKLRVLCLNDDKNENDHAGFTKDCWQWIDRQIKQANDDGCLIIGIEHHLIMPHVSSLITGGSVCVENRNYVASHFADAGLRYMFVGHSHIQATDRFTSKNGHSITEVNVGALCGYPAPIVNVTVNED